MILECLAGRTGTSGFAIYARQGTQDWIDGLAEQYQSEVDAILDYVTEHGVPRNEFKSGSLGNNLFELKTAHTRLIFFYLPDRIVIITHGFQKKTQKTPKQQLRLGASVRDDILEAMQKGNLEYGKNLASEEN